MSQVEFKYNSGASRMVEERIAKILQKLGKGGYLTRDMQAGGLSVDVPVILPALPEEEEPVAVGHTAKPVLEIEPQAVESEAPASADEPQESEEAPRRRGGRPRKSQAEE